MPATGFPEASLGSRGTESNALPSRKDLRCMSLESPGALFIRSHEPNLPHPCMATVVGEEGSRDSRCTGDGGLRCPSPDGSEMVLFKVGRQR